MKIQELKEKLVNYRYELERPEVELDGTYEATVIMNDKEITTHYTMAGMPDEEEFTEKFWESLVKHVKTNTPGEHQTFAGSECSIEGDTVRFVMKIAIKLASHDEL